MKPHRKRWTLKKKNFIQHMKNHIGNQCSRRWNIIQNTYSNKFYKNEIMSLDRSTITNQAHSSWNGKSCDRHPKLLDRKLENRKQTNIFLGDVIAKNSKMVLHQFMCVWVYVYEHKCIHVYVSIFVCVCIFLYVCNMNSCIQ